MRTRRKPTLIYCLWTIKFRGNSLFRVMEPCFVAQAKPQFVITGMSYLIRIIGPTPKPENWNLSDSMKESSGSGGRRPKWSHASLGNSIIALLNSRKEIKRERQRRKFLIIKSRKGIVIFLSPKRDQERLSLTDA